MDDEGLDISLDMKVEVKEEFSPSNNLVGNFGNPFHDTYEVKPDKKYYNDVTKDANSSFNEKRSPSLIIPDYLPDSLNGYNSSIISDGNIDIKKELEFDEDNQSSEKERIYVNAIFSESSDLDNPGAFITNTSNTNQVMLDNSTDPPRILPVLRGKESVSCISVSNSYKNKLHSTFSNKLESASKIFLKHENLDKNLILNDEPNTSLNGAPSASKHFINEDISLQQEENLFKSESLDIKDANLRKEPLPAKEETNRYENDPNLEACHSSISCPDSPTTNKSSVQCGISQQTVIYSTRKSFVTKKYDSVVSYQSNLAVDPRSKVEWSESDPLLGGRNMSPYCTTQQTPILQQRPSFVSRRPPRCIRFILYTIPWVAMIILFTAIYMILPSAMSPPEKGAIVLVSMLLTILIFSIIMKIFIIRAGRGRTREFVW